MSRQQNNSSTLTTASNPSKLPQYPHMVSPPNRDSVEAQQQLSFLELLTQCTFAKSISGIFGPGEPKDEGTTDSSKSSVKIPVDESMVNLGSISHDFLMVPNHVVQHLDLLIFSRSTANSLGWFYLVFRTRGKVDVWSQTSLSPEAKSKSALEK